MTYGWSILLIGLVLAALYAFVVFNSTSVTGNACIPASGYLCQNPVLDTTGLITFTFGQVSGTTIYNVQLTCAATNSGGLPLENPALAFNSIATNGFALSSSNTGNSLGNAQTVTVSALPCYGTTGSLFGAQSLGTGFNGYVWVNYTTSSGTANILNNPWRTSKAITLRTKVI